MQRIRFIMTIELINFLSDSHQRSIWAWVRSVAWWTEIVNGQWGDNDQLENFERGVSIYMLRTGTIH